MAVLGGGVWVGFWVGFEGVGVVFGGRFWVGLWVHFVVGLWVGFGVGLSGVKLIGVLGVLGSVAFRRCVKWKDPIPGER